jgi:hypothetical protein
MQLPRISRKYLHITITATLYDGSPATVNGVDVAFLPSYTTSHRGTLCGLPPIMQTAMP